MAILFWIILANLAVSLAAWVGLLTLLLTSQVFKKIILLLVALSAGALLGAAFGHLMPEAVSASQNSFGVFSWALGGFIFFFLLEQFIQWHHCHRPISEHKKPVSYLILFADSLHNFIDGLVIAAALLAGRDLGLAAFLAILLHELPQELGDFGILIHSGWSKSKALVFNSLSALFAILGGLFGYFLGLKIDIKFLLPFAAGSFIYIAASDLIPEIKQSYSWKKDLCHFAAFLVGVLITWGLAFFF